MCRITVPVEAEVIEFAANCCRREVVVPELIVAVSRLLAPRHDASAGATILSLDVKYESVQSTSNDVVRPCCRVARTWRRITSRRHWRIAWSWRVCWTCSGTIDAKLVQLQAKQLQELLTFYHSYEVYDHVEDEAYRSNDSRPRA